MQTEELFPAPKRRGYMREFTHDNPDPSRIPRVRHPTFNRYRVGRLSKKAGGGIRVRSPDALDPMTREEALNLSAWLFLLADGSDDDEWDFQMACARERLGL